MLFTLETMDKAPFPVSSLSHKDMALSSTRLDLFPLPFFVA